MKKRKSTSAYSSARFQISLNAHNRANFKQGTASNAVHYGIIRAQLERQGTPIGPYDMQIAAIAIANNFTLVTHNTKEFKRIDNLLIEDWE